MQKKGEKKRIQMIMHFGSRFRRVGTGISLMKLWDTEMIDRYTTV